ncbi:MAG: metallophosphoesterase [Comamonadaceae bacterium]|nr:MAG: metallophosphoesterase [Comamonadaceae bacterium]
MNFLPLVAITALLHVYIGARLLPALGAWAATSGISGLAALPWLLGIVLVLSALLMPLGLIGSRVTKGPLANFAHVLTWTGLLFMGLFSTVLVLTAARDVALILLWLVDLAAPGRLPLDAIRIASAQAVPAVGLLVTAIGFLNARRTAAVVRVDVPIKGLPTALQGFTIAQLSDIHVGPTIKKAYLQRIVDKVNALDADAVAITGDLVDGQVPELAEHVAPLSGLRSRHGSFFVTGNHEYYAGAGPWIAELRRLGLRVLLNEHVVLHHGKNTGKYIGRKLDVDAQDDSQMMAPLVLAGVTDFTAHQFDPAHRSDAKAALEGAPPASPVRVLLAHQPRSAAAAAEAGFDLQLSGHTHGGQFYPWNLFVPMQQPFTAGLNRLNGMWVYTSRGTGYWGPPKRFGAPSEITLVTLVAAR